MLDLITRDDIIDLISNIAVSLQFISDHSLVACTAITIRRENQAKHTYFYQNIKNIDSDTFKSNIHLSRLYDTSLSADEYTDVFDKEVRQLLDEAAPMRTADKRLALNDCRRMSNVCTAPLIWLTIYGA